MTRPFNPTTIRLTAERDAVPRLRDDAGAPDGGDAALHAPIPAPTLHQAHERLTDFVTSVEAMSAGEWENYLQRAMAAEEAARESPLEEGVT